MSDLYPAPPFPPDPPAAPGQPGADRPPRPTQATVAGVGLIVGGAVEAVVSGVSTGFAVYDSVRYHQVQLLALVAVIGVVAGAVTVVGGVSLLRARSKVLVYAGAIASMVPGTLCCVVGLAFGILALVILPRPETRAWFGEPTPPTF